MGKLNRNMRVKKRKPVVIDGLAGLVECKRKDKQTEASLD